MPSMDAKEISGEMPSPHERAKRYAALLWENEGKSVVAIAKLAKLSHLRLAWASDTLGFRTYSAIEGRERGKYSCGPCTECWRVRRRESIDASSDYRCKSCVGYEKVRESIPVDIRQELALYQDRVAQDPSRLERLQKRNPFLKNYIKGGKHGTES
jgi:hypothetical protein